MNKKAFTLIELLVVIAIIAILAAILFPVFAQAKAAAKKTAALSNCKQLNLAVAMYLNDHDDVFPMGGGNCWYYPTDGGWAWDTQPYIKSLPLMRDASDPLSQLYWPTWFKGQPVVGISFASNGYTAWSNSAGDNALLGVMGVDQSIADFPSPTSTRCGAGGDTNQKGPGTVNETSVTQPASTIELASRYSGNNLYGMGAVIEGENWNDPSGPGNSGGGTAPGLLPDGNATTNIKNYPNGYYIGGGATLVNLNPRFGAVAAVYANQGIFSFTDGHAKTMNPAATDPDSINTPSSNMWVYNR